MARFGLLAASTVLLCHAHAQTAPSGFPSVSGTTLLDSTLTCPCDALVSAGLSDLVSYPDDATYQASIESYWSGTVQAVTPWCIVRPSSSAEVAKVFKTLVDADTDSEWDIAVRGGGHSHWPSNNVRNGTTIDLSLLSSITYNNCTHVAKIGAGARWGAVFGKVEQFGRSVTGGREGNVGVAGLTLGGGASFHSARRGFACDDIVNYEVVLADGSIVQANAKQHTDLFKALKGGSNNFGIVTRFDMKTFEAPATGVYGGLLFLMYDQKDAILRQFVRFVDINKDNLDDTETVTFTWAAGPVPPQIAMVALNTAGIPDTPSFEPLKNVTSVFEDRGFRTYGEMIRQYVSPGGPRSVWYSLCFHNRLDILEKMSELYEAAVAELEALFPAGSGVGLNFVFQPLGKHFVKAGSNNVLGLDKTLTHDSIIWLVQAFSTTAEQEAVLVPKIAEITAQLEAFAESKGANTPWRYLNYVNPAQNPLGSYGQESVNFMKTVAAKYDPEGVFQTKVPGGFKLSHVQ